MDPKTVVIRYVEAARDGMSAVIRDSFAEDATWEYPGDLPLSGTYRGIDAIVNEFLVSMNSSRGIDSPCAARAAEESGVPPASKKTRKRRGNQLPFLAAEYFFTERTTH
jgi:hypothetical protein